MKHLGKLSLGLGLLSMVAFTSCNNDEPTMPNESEQGVNEAKKDVYASLTLHLPSAGNASYKKTRAVDENGDYKPDGVEMGQDEENNVGKVLVVLATADKEDENGNPISFKFLTKALSDAQPESKDEAANTLTYVLNFSSDNLSNNPLDEGSTIPGTKVYVFAYCNPSDKLIELSDENWGNPTYDFLAEEGTISLDADGDAEIWKKNRFLMTNASISKAVVLPSRAELVKNCSTPEKAFPLGDVEVKRACARFDFQTTTTAAGLNKYEIKDFSGQNVIGTVELTEMAMFNVAKKFYYVQRASKQWAWDLANPVICGDPDKVKFNEDPLYVISSFFKGLKEQVNFNSNIKFQDFFYDYLVSNPMDNYQWVSLKDWNNNHKEDNHNTWTPSDGTNYRIWRYTTENTIPQVGDDNSSQRVGITTGVVFKGVFTPENTEVWNGNAIYVYNNIVYGDYKALYDYVKLNEKTAVAEAFKNTNAFKNKTPENVDLAKSLFVKNASASTLNGFKVYEPKGGVKDAPYEVYYFYYNRHNNNGQPSNMGVNEFGVVRNNVYKLAVTVIRTLGEPETPNNPEDPDEEEHAYFTVRCIVMPWTVRINNIEF